MSILITGAGGFLGHQTVERLLANGHRDLRLLFRSRVPCLDSLRKRFPVARIEAVTGNLLTPASIRKGLDGVKTVFHLAAEMKGSPADMFLNTVVGSNRLLAAAASVRRVVLVSSLGVYGVAGLKRGALIDEQTPLERHPERRDAYSFVKLKQELLVRQYQERFGFELIVFRPGVIYGPGSQSLSTRIGVRLPGAFLQVGGGNVLPLTFVDNCAQAIAQVGFEPLQNGVRTRTFNVVDDDLINCRQYLRRYRSAVKHFRSVSCPYQCAMLLARMCEWYSKKSQGQLPAVLTPYKAAVLWKGNRFSNQQLKSAGWRQAVPTSVGLDRTFQWLATGGTGAE